MNDPSLIGLLALEPEVFEITGIPEGVEVTFQRRLVVDVAWFGEHACSDSLSGDAAVAVNHRFDDQILLSQRDSTQKNNKKKEIEQSLWQRSGAALADFRSTNRSRLVRSGKTEAMNNRTSESRNEGIVNYKVLLFATPNYLHARA